MESFLTSFIPVHTTYNAKRYAEIYLDRIVCLHGVPKTIISDRGTQFTARFWEQLQASLGTKLIRSSAYHPQTDGQTERINQILEDMLRACVIHFDKSWDKCLSLAEFSYNNSYLLTLLSAPICIPQVHGSCSFSFRVFLQGLSIRGSTKNYLRFSI